MKKEVWAAKSRKLMTNLSIDLRLRAISGDAANALIEGETSPSGSSMTGVVVSAACLVSRVSLLRPGLGVAEDDDTGRAGAAEPALPVDAFDIFLSRVSLLSLVTIILSVDDVLLVDIAEGLTGIIDGSGIIIIGFIEKSPDELGLIVGVDIPLLVFPEKAAIRIQAAWYPSLVVTVTCLLRSTCTCNIVRPRRIITSRS